MMDPPASARRLQAGVAKLVGSRLFWLLFVGILFALPLGRSLARTLPPAPPIMGTIEPFELHDQYDHAVTTSQLAGHMWVLAFSDVSDGQGAKFDDQRTVVYRTRNLGSAFRMITITSNPTGDSLAVRRAAVEKHASSANMWAFLGGSPEEVQKATTAVLSPLGATQGTSDLFLIDQHGRIRGIYGTDKPSLDHLMQDISYVSNFPN